MENFFDDDKFCLDIEDLMTNYQIEEEDIKDLPDDWSVKVELTDLEPMFQFNAKDMSQMIHDCNEERLPEDYEDEKEVVKALNECVDFEKLNPMIRKLYYPNGKFETITKQDLIEFCS